MKNASNIQIFKQKMKLRRTTKCLCRLRKTYIQHTHCVHSTTPWKFRDIAILQEFRIFLNFRAFYGGPGVIFLVRS